MKNSKTFLNVMSIILFFISLYVFKWTVGNVFERRVYFYIAATVSIITIIANLHINKRELVLFDKIISVILILSQILGVFLVTVITKGALN